MNGVLPSERSSDRATNLLLLRRQSQRYWLLLGSCTKPLNSALSNFDALKSCIRIWLLHELTIIPFNSVISPRTVASVSNRMKMIFFIFLLERNASSGFKQLILEIKLSSLVCKLNIRVKLQLHHLCQELIKDITFEILHYVLEICHHPKNVKEFFVDKLTLNPSIKS